MTLVTRRSSGAKGPGDQGQSADYSSGRFGHADEHGTGGGNYDYSSSMETGAVMRARVGDMLVVPGNQTRTGLIIRVVGRDGAPPYVIKWLADSHIAMVTPDQYSRIVRMPDGGARQPRDGL
jgi:hypothetical protein